MKKRVFTVILAAVVLSAALMAAGQATGFFDFSKKSKTITITQEEYDRLKRFSTLDDILQYVEAWYWKEPDVDAMLENAAKGLLYALDDTYTFYYSPEEWAEMWEDDEGEYGGIGIQMLGDPNDYSVRITRVFKGSPAEAAGILRGDYLVRVEDIEVNAYSMQNAVNVMRGEPGGEVEVEVKRGEEYLTFHIPRAIIHVNRIESMMLSDQVGYIVLYEFAGESQKEFSDALTALREQGAKALVIDLRDNGGGWVDAAVEVADLFLDEQVLVYSETRYGEREDYKTKNGKDDIPLVILVNGNSASSSEILSGGLQDAGRATLVGTLTYGKGILQTVIPLNNDKDGFQMTYAQYYLPSGKAVHQVGITPDILVEMPEDMENADQQLGDMNDPQLRTAWETAKGMITE